MSLFDKLVSSSLPMVPTPIVKKVASRYVAGASLEDALSVVERLNSEGASATLDVLGEDVAERGETQVFVEEYLRALEGIARRGLDSNVSLKLSSMGLRIDPALAEENLRRVAREARRLDNSVRIDMEDSKLTQATIDLFRRVRSDGDNVGIVLQAYLRRTQADVAMAIAEGWNVRICKGIYIEPESVALRDPDLIRRNFSYVTDRMLEGGLRLGIATHDETMVLEALHAIERRHADPARYEFQMLLGVATGLRRLILAAGHRLRVYVPYGRAWKAYCLRRLKENPAIARHVLKGMFQKALGRRRTL